ncbi:TPA: cation transporter, partial [Clostridioides difficile]
MVKSSTTASDQDSNALTSPVGVQTTLQITGMTCAACSSRIEKGLSRMEGVNQANVNLATEQATISYDPKMVNVSSLRDKVEALGY